MTDLRSYDLKNKLDKITFFIKKSSKEMDFNKIFYLKSINEEGGGKTLLKLKRVIDSNSFFQLALFKNDYAYDFDKLDSEGIVSAVDRYYEIYLIIDKNNKHYIYILQENNFFKNGSINELAYFHEIKSLSYELYFFNKIKLYP